LRETGKLKLGLWTSDDRDELPA